MASFFDKFKKKAGEVSQGIYRQANPFDGGKSYANPQGVKQNADVFKGAPYAAPQQRQRSTASRIFDQVNPLDNGRSFGNSVVTNRQNVGLQGADIVSKLIVRPTVAAGVGTGASIARRFDKTAPTPQELARRNPGTFGKLYNYATAGNKNIDLSKGTVLTGNAIQTASNLLPGSGKLATAGVGKIVPKLGKPVTKAIGATVTGGATGGFAGVGNYLGTTKDPNAKDAIKSGVMGAGIGLVPGAAVGGAGLAKAGGQQIAKKAIVRPQLTPEQLASRNDLVAKRATAELRKPSVVPMIDKQIDAIDALTKPRLKNPLTPMNQGGYVKNPFGKQGTEGLTKEQSAIVNEYANILEDMGQGNGVAITPDGRRVSNNFRNIDNNGAPLSKGQWFDEARKQIEAGKAEPSLQKAYNDLNNPEVASLMKEADSGALNPRVVVSEAVNKGSGTKVQRGIKVENGKPVRFEETVPSQKLATVNKDLPNVSEKPIELKSIQGKTPLDTTPEKVRFTELSNEFLGSMKSGEINAATRAKTYNKGFGKFSEKQKNEVLFGKDDPRFKQAITDGDTLKAIDYLEREFDDAYRYFTQEKGVKLGYQDSYLPRIYENKLGDKITSAEYRLLQKSSGRLKGRTNSDLMEWKLVTRDPAELMKMYYNSMEKAAAGKKFLNDLQKEGFVISSSEPVRGMRPVIAEGMQDNGMIYYARKDVADKLNTMFGTKESSNLVNAAMEKGAGVNSLFQSVVLSGGIPNTPVNAFGIMQVMKEAMAGHPLKAGKAVYAGMSKSFSDKLFTEKADVLKLMAKNGIDPRVDLDQMAKRGFQRAMEKEGGAKKVNAIWDEITNDSTFRRFMPALEVQHFENVYKAGLKKKLPEAEAARIAAESTKNFYGKNSMAKEAFRPDLVQNTSGALLFAPRFRESMLNFWGKNAAALKPGNITKVEYRDNVKFMASAAVMFAAYDILNKELNGTHLWENPDGKKDKLLIPGGENGKTLGIPFLPSIATVPRNAAMFGVNALTGNWGEAGKNAGAFASMPVKMLTELANNENYFGQRIIDEKASTPEKLTQGAAYIAKGTMQPWVREGLNVAGQGLPEGVKKGLGIKEKGKFETISNALETPVRFYDPTYFKGGSDKFKTADGGTLGDQRTATGDTREDVMKSAFGTPEAKQFFAKTDAQQQELADGDPELQALYDQRKAMLTGLRPDKIAAKGKLTDLEVKSLNTWNRLTTEAKTKIGKTDPARKKAYDLANAKRQLVMGEIDQAAYDKKLATLNKVKKAKSGRKSGRKGRLVLQDAPKIARVNTYVKVAPVKKATYKKTNRFAKKPVKSA